MKILAFFCLLLISLLAFADKVYQWRDTDGNVHYSDQPPPSNQTAHQRNIHPNVIGTASQPAAGRSEAPQLVLWMAPQCGKPCEDAVALLDRRKLVYDVKVISPDKEKQMLEFFNLVGSLQVHPPVLQVGKNVLKDFDSAIWSAELTKAGF